MQNKRVVPNSILEIGDDINISHFDQELAREKAFSLQDEGIVGTGWKMAFEKFTMIGSTHLRETEYSSES
jgi:hypothetical protein